MRITLLLLIFSSLIGCTTNLHRVGYRYNEELAKDTCQIPVVDNSNGIPNNAVSIGTLAMPHNSFKENYSREEAIAIVQKEACSIQSDLIYFVYFKQDLLQTKEWLFEATFYKYVSDSVLKGPDMDGKTILKTSPLRPFNQVNPGFELSYERFLKNNKSILISATYLTDPFNVTGFNDFSGEKLNLEYRYYFKDFFKEHYYFGLEFEIFQNRFNEDFTYSDANSAIALDTYYDNVNIEKLAMSLNYKMGVQCRWKKVVLDLDAGIGIRYRSVHHYDKSNPEDEMVGPVTQPNIYKMAYDEGDYFTFNFLISLRLGYCF